MVEFFDLIQQYGLAVLEPIVENLGRIGILGAILAVLSHVVYYWLKKYNLSLQAVLAKATSGFAVPVGVVLVLIPLVDITLFERITNREIYIFASGLTILWLTWSVLFPKSFEPTPRDHLIEDD